MGANKTNIYVNIQSSAPEVTGSCITIEANFPDKTHIKVAVDCGLNNEKKYSNLNQDLLYDPNDIDAFFITHAHIDHIGLLPSAVAKGFKGDIYCTNKTERILPKALDSSFDISNYSNSRNSSKPLFNKNDVVNTINKVKGVKYNDTIKIGDHLFVTFLGNGHIYGAACILMQFKYTKKNSVNLLFTGDYSKENVFFTINSIPKWVKDLKSLHVIQESTYGDCDSSNIQEDFEYNILKAILERKTIIIPAFSLGRFQEMELFIKNLQYKKLLDVSIPIYGDGILANDYTELFKNDLSYFKKSIRDFIPENFKIIDATTRQEVIADDTCKIIICTSGMGTYGASKCYIKDLLNNPNVLFLFSGYTAEDSLGRKLKNTEKGEIVEIQEGISVRKLADVKDTNQFSAHAKGNESICFLKQFKNLRSVYITHGNTNVREIYSYRVTDELGIKDVQILDRGTIYKVDFYGTMKSF